MEDGLPPEAILRRSQVLRERAALALMVGENVERAVSYTDEAIGLLEGSLQVMAALECRWQLARLTLYDKPEVAKMQLSIAEERLATLNKQPSLGYPYLEMSLCYALLGMRAECRGAYERAAGFETPTLFTIAADLTKMQGIADVDEADIGNVENGQRVSFTVDAYPNDVFEGTVMQIRLGDSESTSSSSSTSTSTVVTYEVVISADNPDLKLKPRLTANVTIFTLERDNVLTVPTKSLRFVPDAGMLTQLGYIVSEAGKEAPAGKRLVWIKNGQELKPKAVTVGSTSGNMIEITDGLNEGEELAVDLEASSITPAAEAETERSPFMPGPPGSNKNKKSAK